MSKIVDHTVQADRQAPTVALVLLPGLDGTGLLFANFAASFGSDVKIIVVSYPSDAAHGYSELETITRSFLPRDLPFFLLGESFSGPIAISIAASHPPGLLGLILCCSFARSPRPSLSMFRPFLPVAPVAALPVALLSFFVLGRFSSAALRRSLSRRRHFEHALVRRCPSTCLPSCPALMSRCSIYGLRKIALFLLQRLYRLQLFPPIPRSWIFRPHTSYSRCCRHKLRLPSVNS